MRWVKFGVFSIAVVSLLAAACSSPAAQTLEGSGKVNVPQNGLAVEPGQAAPAEFVVKDLTTSTVECVLGADVWVGVTVSNTGGRSGTYPVVLKIDDTVARTANVTLNVGSSQKVWFILSQETDLPALAPTYTVSVGDLRQNIVVL